MNWPGSARTRRVYFNELGFSTIPVYERAELCAGHGFTGPAIVDQLDTTTVIFPGQKVRVDELGQLFINQ